MNRGDRVELRPILKRDGENARVMYRAVAHGEVLKGEPGAIDIEWWLGMTPPSDETLERQADSLGERLERIEDQLEARRRRRSERETGHHDDGRALSGRQHRATGGPEHEHEEAP